MPNKKCNFVNKWFRQIRRQIVSFDALIAALFVICLFIMLFFPKLYSYFPPSFSRKAEYWGGENLNKSFIEVIIAILGIVFTIITLAVTIVIPELITKLREYGLSSDENAKVVSQTSTYRNILNLLSHCVALSVLILMFSFEKELTNIVAVLFIMYIGLFFLVLTGKVIDIRSGYTEIVYINLLTNLLIEAKLELIYTKNIINTLFEKSKFDEIDDIQLIVLQRTDFAIKEELITFISNELITNKNWLEYFAKIPKTKNALINVDFSLLNKLLINLLAYYNENENNKAFAISIISFIKDIVANRNSRDEFHDALKNSYIPMLLEYHNNDKDLYETFVILRNIKSDKQAISLILSEYLYCLSDVVEIEYFKNNNNLISIEIVKSLFFLSAAGMTWAIEDEESPLISIKQNFFKLIDNRVIKETPVLFTQILICIYYFNRLFGIFSSRTTYKQDDQVDKIIKLSNDNYVKKINIRKIFRGITEQGFSDLSYKFNRELNKCITFDDALSDCVTVTNTFYSGQFGIYDSDFKFKDSLKN